MTTPTISESARRAAWKAYATVMNRMTDGLNYDADKPPHEESIAMKEALQAALDSAHPAPKEGETPETDAIAQAPDDVARRNHINEANRQSTVDEVVPADFARSLELRLSEAKREVEAYRKAGEGKATCGEMSCEECDREKDILRSHLKTANELLEEAKWEIGRPWSDERNELVSSITAHLNQQSK